MSDFEERLAAQRGERIAALQSGGKVKGRLKPQQIIGGALLVLGVIGYLGYSLLNLDRASLVGGKGDTFAVQDDPKMGRMVIGAPNRVRPEVPTTITALTSPPRAIETGDSKETLALLKSLRAAVTSKDATIAKLQISNATLKNKTKLLDDQVAVLNKNLKQFTRLAEDRLKQERALLESRYKTEISNLKARLAIAEANTVVVEDDEQKKRLEALRLLHQQQIQRNAVIFDNSTEAEPGLKY